MSTPTDNADQAEADAAYYSHDGREGSAICCQVLLLMHKHRPLGLSAGDMAVFLGLGRAELAAALNGLQQRGRITCISRGMSARYLLQQDLPRADSLTP